MRIIIPYTDLNPWVELLVKLEHPETEFIDCSASEETYLEVIQKVWRATESFILMEHDILPWPGAIKQLIDCPEPFCMFKAPMEFRSGDWMCDNGVEKFDKSLMEKYPNHMDETNSKDWHNVYYWLIECLKFPKMVPLHIHTPPVLHLSVSRFTNPWNSNNYPGTPTRKGRGPGE